jgi:hypothetical protein
VVVEVEVEVVEVVLVVILVVVVVLAVTGLEIDGLLGLLSYGPWAMGWAMGLIGKQGH